METLIPVPPRARPRRRLGHDVDIAARATFAGLDGGGFDVAGAAALLGGRGVSDGGVGLGGGRWGVWMDGWGDGVGWMNKSRGKGESGVVYVAEKRKEMEGSKERKGRKEGHTPAL